MAALDDTPLRICLLSYRSNPFSGGQGVYIKNLSRALTGLGHRVDVIAGPPRLVLDEGVTVHQLPCLDLYDAENLFRFPTFKELGDPINIVEWLGVSSMGFPEPLTFGFRAWRYLLRRFHHYDVVHDNQCLSYALWGLRNRIPTTITIHHPITRDRAVAIRAARYPWSKLKEMRWFSFIGMQRRVSMKFRQIITVSACARDDISRDFGIVPSRFRIVPNGISVETFRPLPGIEREPNRIMVTNSSDIPMKGLHVLLKAVADISRTRDVRLVVIGAPKKGSNLYRLIKDLDVGRRVTFTGRIDDDEFIRQYARATMAVVPSLYEGFGLPAGEAMACRVPVISTTGGALPEVVGDAGILVPPGDSEALGRAIVSLLDHPDRARELADKGYRRVHDTFTWTKAAEKTVEVYKETILDYRRFQATRTQAG
ncbi:MAG: glycosyltransferase family 4 protein [Proteobacteria bacterium]|nr:glycosyltransferase family 4 protein [Pseudomonadota bacterium]